MDDSLLKEHLKFKKRATQSLEAAASLNNSQQKRFKQNSNRLEEIEGGATESQTTETGTKFSASGSRFGLLASVIQFLKVILKKICNFFLKTLYADTFVHNQLWEATIFGWLKTLRAYNFWM